LTTDPDICGGTDALRKSKIGHPDQQRNQDVKRALTSIAIAVAVIIVALGLYLTLTDFSEYRTDIEEVISEATGREFSIDGEFSVEVFPLSVLAEGVSYANADWGTDLPMLSVGHLSAKIALGSLFFGPVVIEEFRLRDVELLLEENSSGENNWSISDDRVEVDISDDTSDGVPVIVRFAEIENIRVIRRRPESEDRVLTLTSLNVRTTEERFLTAEGAGKLEGRDIILSGKIGPINNFESGENLDLDLEADFGVLAMSVSGNTGNPDTLAGTEIDALITSADSAALLSLLDVPLELAGELRAEAKVALVESRPGITFHVEVEDLEAGGVVAITSEQIDFFVTLSSLERFGNKAGVTGLPDGAATLKGGVIVEGEKIELVDVAFETPEINLLVNATVAVNDEQIMLDPFSIQAGESDISGSLEIQPDEPASISGNIRSRVLDLTPFIGDETEEPVPAQNASDFVFSDDPLPFDFLNAGSVDLDLLIETFRRGPLSLEQFQALIRLNDGSLILESGFAVTDGGNATGNISLVSRGDSADAEIRFDASDLRLGLGDTGDRSADQIPLLGLSLDINTTGHSLHSLAAGANGKVLLTQGPGQVDNNAMGFFSADILSELFSALNPFAKKDPYSNWECTVFALNIIDGVSSIEPMLAQSEKVTIVGAGSIDFNDESLDIRFNTKPRKGVGVSADMFVTPFIMLGGTMNSPRLALDKTGILVSGGAAVLTGGLSFLVQGAADRATGAQDRCAAALALAKGEKIEVAE
jgi:uncharacterized protein involved in outer membrane biogenesis